MKLFHIVAVCVLAAATPAVTAAQQPTQPRHSRASVGLGTTYFPSFFGAGGVWGLQLLTRLEREAGSGMEIAYTHVPKPTGGPSVHAMRVTYALTGRASDTAALSFGLNAGASVLKLREITRCEGYQLCGEHSVGNAWRFAPTAGIELGFAITPRLEIPVAARTHYAFGGGWRNDASPWMAEFSSGLRFRF